MDRFARRLSYVLALGLVLLAGRSLSARAAPSATVVCGSITTNTTWTLAGSPYGVCTATPGAFLTVNSGVALTIEPGVVVQVANDSQFNLQGTLTALGTAAQPITFTGVLTTPTAWRGVDMQGSARMALDHVTFEHSGSNSSTGAQIRASSGTLTMTHSLLRDGAGAGVYVASSARVSIHDTQFLNHGRQAVVLSGPENGVDLGGLSASGNSRDVVYVNSTTYFDDAQVWPNAGIPYLVDGLLGTFEGGSLTIAPGSELRFTSLGGLFIRGDFKAIGLPNEPIVLTGDVITAPVIWDGLTLYGLTRPATGQLEYVTIDYGGEGISSGANINVDYGHLIASHITVRYSDHDGVLFGSNGTGSVLSSQIYSNTVYGVHNAAPNRPVLATNNWWGHPGGPKPDVSQCGTGLGDRVSSGVIFRPVLTDTNTLDPFPLSDAPNLTLTPRRWFAPSDNFTRVYFDITLRDGDGVPLPGRTVSLTSSRGIVTGGGVTDANGHTLAYLVSNTAGSAEVVAALQPGGNNCESALSPTAQVTFVPPVNITELFPDSPAPYMDGNITVSPEPIAVGVPTTLAAKITNPLTVPITVDVSFGFAQAGIGLAFGPLQDFVGQVIPAGGNVTLSKVWVPTVSGHYCVQVTYNITAVGGGVGLASTSAGGSGYRQRNLDVRQGPTGSSDKPGTLDRTRTMLDLVNAFVDHAFDTDPFSLPLQLLNMGIVIQLNTADIIFSALGGDPPRQDYQQLTIPQKLTLPPQQSGGSLSQARADAINALADALAEANAAGRAAVDAFDRSGGAAEAGNLQWQSTQTAAMLEYNRRMGLALIDVADKLDALLQVGANEGVTSVMLTAADVTASQAAVAGGFRPELIADAHALGMSDAEIEAMRQRILAADPQEQAGDLILRLQQLSARLRILGEVLVNPVAFRPSYSVGGSPGLQAASPAAVSAGNTMVQLDNTTATLQLGNPLSTTTAIDVRTRRIDLPADWTVSVFPAQATLAPGEQTTITVTIGAGAPLPQGAKPTVAVEGYAGSQLLGGVVVRVSAPQYVFFDGFLRVYLPLALR
jgi:hypothetical protein